MALLPDGLIIVFTKLCRYGRPGDIKTISYSTGDQLCARGFAQRYYGPLPWEPPSPNTPFKNIANRQPEPPPPASIPASEQQTFTLVSMKNGCGLQTDYEILQKMLTDAGKTVRVAMAHSDVLPTFRKTDVVVFLEILDHRWLEYGKEFWLFPNSEWWRKDWDQYLPRINKVLCKTRDCYDLWETRTPGKCTYLGFESPDLYAPHIPRKREFLHLAGGSCNKGTAAVLQAWKQFKIPHTLTVVSRNYQGLTADLLHLPNVKMYRQLPELVGLHNMCQFHILPSRYEGWGHVLHEGLGCGAVMLTTDAAPMNEATGLPKSLLVPVSRVSHQRVLNYTAGGESISNMYDVSPESVYCCVRAASGLTDEQIAVLSKEARDGFLKDREEFRANFAKLISPPIQELEMFTEHEQVEKVNSKPRDIVLVTTFFRPEYLWTCLNAIAEADGGAEKEVWVAQDHHSDARRADANYPREQAENAEIVEHFRNKFASFRFINRVPKAYDGNSYNCLELYKEAYNTDARLVYLVEDDIFVEKDFFTWHEAVQQKGDYLCSVGRLQTTRPDLRTSDDPEAYVESSSDYTSWGSCWRREKLAPLVEHACEDYYRNMTGYIVRRFPNSPLKNIWTEQDGLIRRVLMEGNGKRLTASPCLKRAYHIGITGYHRSNGYQFTGTLAEKVQQLNDALKSGALPGLRKDFVDLNDIDVPRGSTPPWSELRAIQRLS